MSKEPELIVSLYEPHVAFKEAFLKAFYSIPTHADKTAWLYLGDYPDFGLPERDFEAYVESLLIRKKTPPPDFVRDTVYWAFVGDDMVGRISIRHELNDFLKTVGGHIGYITHPRFRKMGIASQMLSEILKTDQAKKIQKLLLTCDEDNLPSEKTILKNGGVYSRTVLIGPGDRKKKHFWIQL